jgi:hypothetical protein
VPFASLRRPEWVLLLSLSCGGCAIPIIGATPDPQPEARRPARAARHTPAPRGSLATTDESGDACYAALAAERIAFERVPPERALGVESPVRLTGPIHGVEVVASGRERVHAILDCRLALALLSWAPALHRAGVVRIEHYSIYRPHARTARKGRVSGHARGLAIDAARFHLDDGEVLDVLTDWEDRERGRSPCPRRNDEARPARVLRSVVCDAVESNLFQVVLTPHHDRAHENHVHLEIRPEVNWTYVR